MTTHTDVSDTIRTFLVKEMLDGDGTDLENSTPLLELRPD